MESGLPIYGRPTRDIALHPGPGVKWTLLALRRDDSDAIAIASNYTCPVNQSAGPGCVSVEFRVIFHFSILFIFV
jgi:hypothetical protein